MSAADSAAPGSGKLEREDLDERALIRQGLRLAGKLLRDARRQFTSGIAGSVLYAAMTVASAIVLGEITDRVILPAFEAGEVATGALAVSAAAIMGVSGLKAFGIFWRRYGAYRAQYALQERYRLQVTRQYLTLPLEWHRRHATGELLSNANADVEATAFLAAPLPMSIGSVVMLAITGAWLLVADPFLAAIGFVVFPGVAVANWLYQYRMRDAATSAQRGRAEVSEIAHESFDAAIVVKTLGREDAETERFAASAERLRDDLIEVGRLRALFDPVIEGLPNVGVLLVLLVGAQRVADGALSAGDLVEFAYLFRLVALPMRVFGWMLGELPRGVVGWDRVANVIGADGAMRFGARRLERTEAAEVDVDAVSYRHPASAREDLSTRAPAAADEPVEETRGIADVSFDLPAGATVAVVGPTGAGKSTVAALLARLFDPQTGAITVDGTPIGDLERDELSDSVAMVFQESFLFDDTVRQNIALGEDFTEDEIRWAAELAAADGFIRELDDGYDTHVGERGATLSGGQRQRIALARALVRRPRLLILDDATSAVDPAVESEILDALSGAELASTVVIVAYRRGSIALSDRVVFVREGRIAAQGTHHQLFEQVPEYRNLVTAYEHADAERQAAR